MRGGVTGSDRKIERWSFLWCCYNNARGEIFVYYEKKKGIRRVVIMIHKLEITGGLLHGKRCPFAMLLVTDNLSTRYG